MRKKIFIYVLLSFHLLSAPVLAVSYYSFRVQGLGRGLVDFMHDDYSNVFYNPARITRSRGTRLFTSLNNLQSDLMKDRLMDQSDIGDFSLLPYPLYDNKGWFTVNDFGDIPVSLVGFMAPVIGGNTLLMIEAGGFSGKGEITYKDESIFGTDRIKDEDTYTIDGGVNMYGVTLARGFGENIGILLAYKNWTLNGFYEEKSQYTRHDSSGQLLGEYNSTDSFNTDIDVKNMDFKLGFLIDSARNNEKDLIFYAEPLLVLISGGFFNHEDFLPWPGAGLNNEDNDGMGGRLYGSGYTFGTKFRTRTQLGRDSSIRKFFKGNKVTWNWIFGFEYTYIPIEVSYTNYNYSFIVNGPNETTSSEVMEQFNGKGTGHLFQGNIGTGGEINVTDNARVIFGINLNIYYLTASLRLDSPEKTTSYRFQDTAVPGNNVAYVRKYNMWGDTDFRAEGVAGLFDFPVGLEIRMARGLFLRIGASSMLPVFFYGKITGDLDTRWREETQYTEGPSAGTTVSSEGIPGKTGQDFNTHLFSTTVDYSFGLGYHINNALSIDLLHFAKITELGTWMLSVNFKFGIIDKKAGALPRDTDEGKIKAYLSRADHYMELEDFKKARESLNAAMKISPDNKYIHFKMGKSYYLQNNYITALKYFENALRLDRNYSEAGNMKEITIKKIEGQPAEQVEEGQYYKKPFLRLEDFEDDTTVPKFICDKGKFEVVEEKKFRFARWTILAGMGKKVLRTAVRLPSLSKFKGIRVLLRSKDINRMDLAFVEHHVKAEYNWKMTISDITGNWKMITIPFHYFQLKDKPEAKMDLGRIIQIQFIIEEKIQGIMEIDNVEFYQ